MKKIEFIFTSNDGGLRSVPAYEFNAFGDVWAANPIICKDSTYSLKEWVVSHKRTSQSAQRGSGVHRTAQAAKSEFVKYVRKTGVRRVNRIVSEKCEEMDKRFLLPEQLRSIYVPVKKCQFKKK